MSYLWQFNRHRSSIWLEECDLVRVPSWYFKFQGTCMSIVRWQSGWGFSPICLSVLFIQSIAYGLWNVKKFKLTVRKQCTLLQAWIYKNSFLLLTESIWIPFHKFNLKCLATWVRESFGLRDQILDHLPLSFPLTYTVFPMLFCSSNLFCPLLVETFKQTSNKKQGV